jgi:hypothetical protein
MTFPIAMWRVSQKEKFRGFHVKFLTYLAIDSQKKLPHKSPEVVPFTNTSTETAIASSPTDKTVQAVSVSAG